MSNYFQFFLLNLNSIVCILIFFRVFLWRMSNKPSGFLQSIGIYLLLISSAAVAIRTITGEYYYADWSEAVINLALCFSVYLNAGNIFHRLNEG